MAKRILMFLAMGILAAGMTGCSASGHADTSSPQADPSQDFRPELSEEQTVIPFCTSSSSDLGESGELLAEAAGTGNWLEGERFSSGASEETVQEWVESLDLGQ